MTNLYLSLPQIPAECLPYLTDVRVAVMAAEEACEALAAELAAHGVTSVALAPHDKLTAYDVIIACGNAAVALAGLAAADFHIAVGYTRTEDGDTRMQAMAQITDLPIFALGETGAMLTCDGEEPRFFGEVSAYYPIMLLHEEL